MEAQRITVTEQGSAISAIPYSPLPESAFTDEKLCCKYAIKIHDDRVVFTLVRDAEMVKKLLKASAALGVRHAIGLYQQHIFP